MQYFCLNKRIELNWVVGDLIVDWHSRFQCPSFLNTKLVPGHCFYCSVFD